MKMAKKMPTLLILVPVLSLAQIDTASIARKTNEEAIRRNPTYSEAIELQHRSPQELMRERESALAKATLTMERLYRLPWAAKAALEAGELVRAEQLAQEAVDLGKKNHQRDQVLPNGDPISEAGDAEFYGHLVLGRVAILRGDVEEAKKHLILAGKTFGAPNLDAEGPNMSLARELLLHSEREAVLEFFQECKNFWKVDWGKLDAWTAEVKAGGVPDFGLHLYY
jgi:hypothetical protein